jgi:hypothetical protein
VFFEVIETVTTDCWSVRTRNLTRHPSATSSVAAESLYLCGLVARFADRQDRDRRQADDLVTVQCFEKWLKAAANEAPQQRAVDFHLGDP